MGTGTTAANQPALHSLWPTSFVRPQRSFLHPGRSIPTPTRAAAVKIGRRSGRAASATPPGCVLNVASTTAPSIGPGEAEGLAQDRPSNAMFALPSNTVSGLTCSTRTAFTRLIPIQNVWTVAGEATDEVFGGSSPLQPRYMITMFQITPSPLRYRRGLSFPKCNFRRPEKTVALVLVGRQRSVGSMIAPAMLTTWLVDVDQNRLGFGLSRNL